MAAGDDHSASPEHAVDLARIRSIPGAALPFERDEYARRLREVWAAIDKAELDGLVVTSHASLEYLTGYPASGGYFAPFALVVTPDTAPVLVVRAYDQDAAVAQSWIDDVRVYAQEVDQPAALASGMRALGLDRGHVGMELATWNLAPADVTRLTTELDGIQVVDATALVPGVAAVKSASELGVMRASAALTDLAIDTFARTVRPGVSERTVARAIDDAVANAGGVTSPPYPVLFGRRTALPHGSPSDFAIDRDDVAFTEVAGWYRGYAAASCRSLVIGRHPEAESLHAVAEEALAAAIAAIRPGVVARDVDKACRGVVERAGQATAFRHRTGYQDGIRWFYRGGFSVDPTSQTVLAAGMTMHLAINLFRAGEFGVGASQCVAITETGAEALTRSSAALIRIE